MANLMLHCGADAISREALYALPEPTPMGPRHRPIHHADFIEAVEGELILAGYDIKETAMGVTGDGARLFGVMDVQHARLPSFDGGAYSIGFRGSHDQTISRGLAAGSHIFVCDNMAFNGEVVMNTKQTTEILSRLPTMIREMIEKLDGAFRHQVVQLDAYRTNQISHREADAAILEMGRQGVVNWGELGKVVQEWDAPSHEEHTEGGHNVWRLFNAATETLKLRNPTHPRLPNLAPKTIKLHAICDELAGLKRAA